jgi:hypothetical protein
VAEGYNPIVRVFGRLRAALSAATGAPRREIGPGTELESLLPRDRRRKLWRNVEQQGVNLPPLERSWGPLILGCLMVVAGPVGITVLLRHWAGLLTVVPLGVLAILATRPWAIEFPIGLRTVGELALDLTHYAEHLDSGHRWTRNEIAFKVRAEIAGAMGRSLSEVRLECRLRADLGA